MNPQTKHILTRWQSLDNGDGLRQAKTAARVLTVAGFVLCLCVVFGVAYGFHPIAIAVAATIMGWVIAERNALQTRAAQWPILKRYIDWKRVEADLRDDGMEN